MKYCTVYISGCRFVDIYSVRLLSKTLWCAVLGVVQHKTDNLFSTVWKRTELNFWSTFHLKYGCMTIRWSPFAFCLISGIFQPNYKIHLIALINCKTAWQLRVIGISMLHNLFSVSLDCFLFLLFEKCNLRKKKVSLKESCRNYLIVHIEWFVSHNQIEWFS